MSSALASSRGGAQLAASSAKTPNIAAPGGHHLFIAFAIKYNPFRGLIAAPWSGRGKIYVRVATIVGPGDELLENPAVGKLFLGG